MPSLSNNCGCSGGGSTTIVIPDVDELVKKTQNQNAVAGLTAFTGTLSAEELVVSGNTNLQSTTVKDLASTGPITTTSLLATDSITTTRMYADVYENLPVVDLDPLTLDSTNHRVGINDLAPSEALDVTGNIATTGNVYVDGQVYAVGDITSDNRVVAHTVYATTYQNLPAQPPASILPITIDPSNNRVGINDPNPSEALDVVGNIATTGNAYVDGTMTANTVYATNYQNLPIQPPPSLLPLTLDASTNRVGVNNPIPTEALDVAGNLKTTGNINALGTISAATVDAANYLNLPPIPPSTFLPITLDQSNNRVGINKPVPLEALDITGNLKTSGNINTDGTMSAGTVYATTYLNLPSTPAQNLLPLTLNQVTNRVGINKTTPLEALDVVGNITSSGNINANGTMTANTVSATTYLNLPATPAPNLLPLTLDQTNNRVGINKTTPVEALDVVGNIDCTGDLSVGGSMKSSSANVLGTMTVDSVNATTVSATNYLNLPSITPQILPITVDATNNRVGINKSSPTATLDVVGDVHSTGNVITDNFIACAGLGVYGTIQQEPPGSGTARLGTTTVSSLISEGTINKTGSTATSVAIGPQTSVTNQGTNAVAIGDFAGQIGQASTSTAIGLEAGQNYQGQGSVAIGPYAGKIGQGLHAISIGEYVGTENQGEQCIAIGYGTAQIGQQSNAIAIGPFAGSVNQKVYSIAIGFQAGQQDQHERSIAINATGAAMNTTGTDRCFIAPIRGFPLDLGVGALSYDASSKELVYSSTGPLSGWVNRTTVSSNLGSWSIPSLAAGAISTVNSIVTVGAKKAVRLEYHVTATKPNTTSGPALVFGFSVSGVGIILTGSPTANPYPSTITSNQTGPRTGSQTFDMIYRNRTTGNQTIQLVAYNTSTSVTIPAGGFTALAGDLVTFVTSLN